MSTPETTGPLEQKPPGRFKQSRDSNSEAVDNWLKGTGQIVFAIIGIIMVLGVVYFALFV